MIQTKGVLLNRISTTYLQLTERYQLCSISQRSQILQLYKLLLSPPKEWALSRRWLSKKWVFTSVSPSVTFKGFRILSMLISQGSIQSLNSWIREFLKLLTHLCQLLGWRMK